MTLSQGLRKWEITRIKKNHYEVVSSGFEISENNGTSQHINYEKDELIEQFQHYVESEIHAIEHAKKYDYDVDEIY
jgi:hypothetical protein